MKTIEYLKYLLLILLIFNAGCAQKNDLESRIDRYLSPLIKGENFSGSILIHQNDEIIFSKGYGFANIPFGIKNSSQTRFHICSLSKSFTAASILLLEERGSLQLSDPITEYIPELNHFTNVTIHHLLSHRSGIPDINHQPEYRNLLNNNQTPSTLIDVIKEYEPEFKPGEKYSYSNSNYNVLACVIEVTSGEDYGTFLKDHIFDPLDLRNTGHHKHMGELIENLAEGYVPAGGCFSVEKAPYIDWSAKTGNGSLYSTTEDLLKWITSLMGGEVLPESSLKRMIEQGYGWFVGEKLDEKVIYYNGNSTGFNSYLGYFPNKNLTIIVLGNNDIPLATTIGEGLASMILNGTAKDFQELKPIHINQEFIKSVEGTYKFPWYSFAIIARKNMLVYKGSYPYYEVSMIPLEENKLFNRFFWSNLVIERNKNGEVIYIYWEGSPQQKGIKIEK